MAARSSRSDGRSELGTTRTGGVTAMAHARRTPERLSALSDGVFAVLITVLVLELRPPELPTFDALLSQLCRELPLHCDRVGQSPPSHALRHRRDAAPDLV